MTKLLTAFVLVTVLVACDHSDHGAADPNSSGGSALDHGHDHAAGSHAHDASSAGAAGTPVRAEPLFDTPLVDSAKWLLFGVGVHQGDAVPVAEVLADPKAFEGRAVRIAGPIASVDQAAGSWIRLGSPDSGVFVRFKDHGFSLPSDTKGVAIVEGFVHVEEVSGEHEAAAGVTESGVEVEFEAHGVAVAKGS